MAWPSFTSWFRREAGADEAAPALARLRRLPEEEFRGRLVAALRLANYEVEAHAGQSEPYDLVLRRQGERTLVQYRHWRALSVPARAVRSLHAFAQTEGAAGSTVVTCGRFNARTQTFARAKSVQLIDGPTLLESMPSIVRATRRESLPAEPHTSYLPEAWSAEEVALAAEPPVADLTNAPSCPRCGSEMVLMFAQGGGAEGHRFWACVRTGQCKGSRPA